MLISLVLAFIVWGVGAWCWLINKSLLDKGIAKLNDVLPPTSFPGDLVLIEALFFVLVPTLLSLD